MTTYCGYCYSRYHARWNCPVVAEASFGDTELAMVRAEHLADQLAEREMVQAQTPVVNVEEEAQ